MLKIVLTIVVALLVGAATAYAAQESGQQQSGAVGAAELDLLVAIFTGNIGLLMGLAITIMGIFQFVKGDAGGAIYTIVLGVLITMLPGIYNGLRMIACPIAESLGGHCGS